MNNENAKNTNSLKGILTGRFLTSNRWAKNWPFVLYISFLALIMIASSHSAERKVHEIARLQSKVKELNSQHVDIKSRLMQESLESKVVKRARKAGLVKGEKPPRIIEIKEEELH